MNIVTLQKGNENVQKGNENGKNNGSGRKGKKNKKHKQANIVKSRTWNIEDTTNHSCPYAYATVHLGGMLLDEIMKVYLYGLRNDIEISIYAKIIGDGIQNIREISEIYVPLQENGSASVGLLETVPLEWNCIIHSHPSSVKTFSQQDWLTLMVNRDCCLLINDGKFTDGKYRISMPCGSVLYSNVTVKIEDNGIGQKIKKKKVEAVQWNECNYNDGYGYNGEIAKEWEEYYKTIGACD